MVLIAPTLTVVSPTLMSQESLPSLLRTMTTNTVSSHVPPLRHASEARDTLPSVPGRHVHLQTGALPTGDDAADGQRKRLMPGQGGQHAMSGMSSVRAKVCFIRGVHL